MNIHKTPAVSKTSLWTSKIQTISSSKITFTTRHEKMDTTNVDKPTTKPGKVIYTRRMYGFLCSNCNIQRNKKATISVII